MRRGWDVWRPRPVAGVLLGAAAFSTVVLLCHPSWVGAALTSLSWTAALALWADDRRSVRRGWPI